MRRDRLLQRERGEISNCRERQEKDVRRTAGRVNYRGGDSGYCRDRKKMTDGKRWRRGY